MTLLGQALIVFMLGALFASAVSHYRVEAARRRRELERLPRIDTINAVRRHPARRDPSPTPRDAA